MPDILTQLAALADLQDQQAALLQAQRTALPTYLRARLDAIAARFQPQLDAIQTALTLAEKAVKAAVLAHGQTVTGARVQAVFVAGRVSWNDDKLQGYAVDHSDILAFRTLGKPSVTLRKVE